MTVEKLVIGRPGSDADISVRDDDYVSTRHAEVTKHEDGTVTVRDLGSMNGTWVNGVRVYGPTRLRSGDRLRVGRTEVVLPS